MATDAQRKAIVYVTVVASCPMCPTYMFNRVPSNHAAILHRNADTDHFFILLKPTKIGPESNEHALALDSKNLGTKFLKTTARNN